MSKKIKSKAERMATAIEDMLPRIYSMWDAFPYAHEDGDSEAIKKLEKALKGYKEDATN